MVRKALNALLRRRRGEAVQYVWYSGIPFTKEEEEQYGNRN